MVLNGFMIILFFVNNLAFQTIPNTIPQVVNIRILNLLLTGEIFVFEQEIVVW